jgi:hypothetical protein
MDTSVKGRALLLLPLVASPSACSSVRSETFVSPDMARIAFTQEVLSRIEANAPVCLSVDPRTGSLKGPNPTIAGGWTVADPSPDLMVLVSQPGLVRQSECPPKGGAYLASLGPLLIHRSGRIEGQIAYGEPRSATIWYTRAKLETCVAERVDGEVKASCKVVPRSR